MTDGRALPWVRETLEYQPTATWSVPVNGGGHPAYRDVVILDAQNAFADSYNLTARPIDAGSEEYLLHRDQLKARLVAVATPRDDDSDKLSDAWELECYGHLAATPSTPAANGASALECYSSGQLPLTPDSRLVPRIGIKSLGGQDYATFVYRRRLGRAGGLIASPEASVGLTSWTHATALSHRSRRIHFLDESVENPYDGTGTEIVTLRSLEPIENTPALWARLRLFFPAP